MKSTEHDDADLTGESVEEAMASPRALPWKGEGFPLAVTMSGRGNRRHVDSG